MVRAKSKGSVSFRFTAAFRLLSREKRISKRHIRAPSRDLAKGEAARHLFPTKKRKRARHTRDAQSNAIPSFNNYIMIIRFLQYIFSKSQNEQIRPSIFV
jgi:hypothetical protein